MKYVLYINKIQMNLNFKLTLNLLNLIFISNICIEQNLKIQIIHKIKAIVKKIDLSRKYDKMQYIKKL